MKDGFPEAPASVTYSVTSKGGYPALFTVRAETGLDLLDTMVSIEKKLTEKGYTPQIRQGFKKEIQYVDGKLCPKDEGKLKIIVSKKDGKPYWACDNGRYDFTTKITTGCDFICSPDTYEVKKKAIEAEKNGSQEPEIPDNF